MRIARLIWLICLVIFSGVLLAGSGSSVSTQINTYNGTADFDVIQVEAYNVAAKQDRLVCFDLKNLNYRDCTVYSAQGLNVGPYFDLTGILIRKELQVFFYDRKNQKYILCKGMNCGSYSVFIPEGYEMAAAADLYDHLAFYCRWKENPELTVDCDLAQPNVAPSSNAILKIPAGKVVVGVSYNRQYGHCPCQKDIYENIYVIAAEDYWRLKKTLDKRWEDYKKSFPTTN